MISLPGYIIGDEIGSTPEWVLLRAQRSKDETPVLLKLPRREDSGNMNVMFGEEERMLQNCSVSCLLRVLEFQNIKNNPVLVLDQFPGTLLESVLDSRPMAIEQLLVLSTALSHALSELHDGGFLHCALSPDAILVDQRTHDIRFTGFFAARRMGEYPGRISAHITDARTVPFIAPEQSGRLNREIDRRTDLYSLGCVIYRCATGHAPFEGKDPMDIIHSHLAQKPVSPEQQVPDFPPTLAKILLTLLAKDPDQRYQSAASLHADLQRCRDEYHAHGEISAFVPARHEAAGRFNIPQHLLGRSTEMARLMECFEHAMSGTVTSIFVDGYTGVGKSALVHEMIPVVTAQRGYFIKGKADQIHRDVPYYTLTSAIQDFVAQILMEDRSRIAFWQSRFRMFLLPVAGVVTRLIPGMEFFLGTQHHMEELRQSEAINRFREAIRRLMMAISDENNPLILFLDDLQWGDIETLHLLHTMIETQNLHHLMLVGALRGHEIDEEHPIHALFDDLASTDRHHGTIELDPLTIDQVTQLLAETLSTSRSYSGPLAELLHQKTQGNPFFLKQILTILYEKRLLRFDQEEERWIWEHDQIDSMPQSESVFVLLTERINAYPTQTQSALTMASFLGGTFSLSTVAAIRETRSSRMQDELRPAIEARLVLPSETTDRPVFQLPGRNGDDRAYHFLHDRVQQAAYALTPEEERPSLHLKIGRLLQEHIPEDQIHAYAFMLADQFNPGIPLITDDAECLRLAEINYIAGMKAAESVAFTAASNYFRTAVTLIKNDWSAHHSLLWKLTHQLGRALYALGNHDEAAVLFDRLSSESRTTEQSTQAITERVHLLIHFSRYREALELGREGLAILGQRIPRRITRVHVAAEILRVEFVRRRKSREQLMNLPPMTDDRAHQAIKLMSALLTAAYFASAETIGLFNCRMMWLVTRHGHMESSGHVFSQYGLILGAGLGRHKTAYELGQMALELQEDTPFPYWKTRTYLTLAAVVNHWTHDARECLPLLEKARQSAEECGDLLYGLYARGFTLQTMHFLGESLDALLPVVMNGLEYCQRVNHPPRGTEVLRQLLMDLRGESSAAGEFDVGGFDFKKEEADLLRAGDSSSISQYRNYRLMSLYYAGRIEEAADVLEESSKEVGNMIGQLLHVDYVFFAGLTAAAMHRHEGSGSKRWKRILVKHMRTMRKWSRNCPQNFAHRALLLEGEWQNADGNTGEALTAFEHAFTVSADRCDFQVMALSAQAAAGHAQRSELPGLASIYARRAADAYLTWGAERCAAMILEQYPHAAAETLRSGRNAPDARAVAPRSSLRRDASESYDIASLMKAATAITGEIRLRALLDKLMSIMVENAGAERGTLFLKHDNVLLATARWDPVGKKSVQLDNLAVEETSEVPVRIIRFVERTQQPVVLDNAVEHERFAQGDIQDRNVHSVLCAPIHYQSELIGVVYLENNLTRGAFSDERIEFLQLLSSQVATALVNARLYARLEEAQHSLQQYSEDLEIKVQERTSDLERREAELRNTNEQLQATILDLKRAQAQLVQAEKMASLGELTTGIAHELQNPLNFIKNFSELSLELAQELQRETAESIPGDLGEETTAILKSLADTSTRIHDHSLRASNIVRNMLDHSHSGGQARVLSNINDLVREALDLGVHGYMLRHEEFTVAQDVQFETDLPDILVIPGDISRVFLNLITNALFFMRKKSLHAQDAYEPKLTVRTRSAGDTIEILIHDNGPGIEEQAKGKIFQPFFTTKSAGEGTGLGLSISYNIVVDGHGGELTVATSPDEGTEFTIRLPRVFAPSDTQPPAED